MSIIEDFFMNYDKVTYECRVEKTVMTMHIMTK